MNKTIAHSFGLAALALSLFASTAFAGNTPAPTQVIVTNTPAQPMPVVGLVTDADNPARQFFQTNLVNVNVNGGGMFYKIASAPAAQKLVIENVSGFCSAPVNWVSLRALNPSPVSVDGELALPAGFWNGSGPNSMLVRFYVKAADDFGFFINSGGASSCHLAVSGYYVN
ncbi:MAG TPA: hypothetical protein VFB00_04415 [Terriglobales bacterium]|nr:hypothetical protein [Terriglobales bacterium]